MKQTYAFTLNTKIKLPDAADSIFGEDGAFVGKILHRSKIAIDENNIFYSYDIASSPDFYKKLNTGYKLYKITDFTISDCTVLYL